MHSQNPSALRDTIVAQLNASEQQGLMRLEKQILRKYVNLNSPRDHSLNLKPDAKEIKAAILGKNLVVMCGGGKDSLVVLTGARAIQLSILEKYGETFQLRVCVGRQPGMIDATENLDQAFKALKLYDDPSVELLYIDGKQVHSFDKDVPLPKSITDENRNNVLMNGHIFSGAGRRTFCDDCNKNLSRWIATALSYKKGADLFMSGDSPEELRTQIGTDVPRLANQFNLEIPDQPHLSATQQAFSLLDQVGQEHSRRVHGVHDHEKTIEAEQIPLRTAFVPFFSVVGYDSKDRLELLQDFLHFDFDSLAFSFTETDCANPALMADLYGRIAQHAHTEKGMTYADGVRMYVDYGTKKMREKGFPETLIEKMKERYQDDNTITQMRSKIEAFAMRAYGLSPENLTAMVYAPFAEQAKNMDRYIDYLKKSEHPYAHQIASAKSDIKQMLASIGELPDKQKNLAGMLEELTGLNLDQMRRLYQHQQLAIDNFEAGKPKGLADIMGQSDTLYSGIGQLGTAKDPVQIPIYGR